MDGYSRYEKLKIRVYDKKEEKEHFHQEIELLYLLEGTMELAVADRKIHLETDDIIVELHELDLSATTPIEALNILYKLQIKLKERI